MNYYYPSYYNNPYMMPSYPSPQSQSQSVLNGKVVDSQDVVKATEVPIGGYGIFPKADLSEIYIKSWNNNGTTSLITYQPVVQQSQQVPASNNYEPILNRLSALESKLDMVLNLKSNVAGTKIVVQQQKEGNENNGK